jgi:hypothetical protein
MLNTTGYNILLVTYAEYNGFLHVGEYHNTVQGYNAFEVDMYIKAGCSIHSTYWNMGMPTGYELKRIKL